MLTRIPRAKRLKSGMYLERCNNGELCLTEVGYDKATREFFACDYPHYRVTDTITNADLKDNKLYGPISVK